MRSARSISVTLILVLWGLWGYGQARVTGHVSAEVVESVSATCSSTMCMSVNAGDLKQLDLGSFRISGQAQATCALVINNANVRNSRGETFTLQTTTTDDGMPLIADQNGVRSLNLIASSDETLVNDQYLGNYGVTFAYN